MEEKGHVWRGEGVWSSEMVHQPPALPLVAPGGPGVNHAWRGGVSQPEVGKGLQLPQSSEDGMCRRGGGLHGGVGRLQPQTWTPGHS